MPNMLGLNNVADAHTAHLEHEMATSDQAAASGGFSGCGNNSSGCQSHRWGGVLSSRMLEVLAAMEGLSEAMAVAIQRVEVSP